MRYKNSNKAKDHKRRGKSGWVGGNPRYSDSKPKWKDHNCRSHHKRQGLGE